MPLPRKIATYVTMLSLVSSLPFGLRLGLVPLTVHLAVIWPTDLHRHVLNVTVVQLCNANIASKRVDIATPTRSLR